MIQSMTGFASRTFSVLGNRYKIEVKTLNHRFLEIKLRTPREWSGLEHSLRAWVEAKLKRGSVELWIEKFSENASSAPEISVHWAQAEHAMKQLAELKKKFKIETPVSVRDLLQFPDVLSKGSGVVLSDEQSDELQEVLLSEVNGALQDLSAMRTSEGTKLQKAMLFILQQLRATHTRLVAAREMIKTRSQEKIKKKLQQCFEAYSTPDGQMRALLETRIAQEISIVLEKADVEEELTRFSGHLDAIEKLLQEGGLIGKKLDFLFQELNREINTLGNKAQDLGISQEVIAVKTAIEQLREQSLNIE